MLNKITIGTPALRRPDLLSIALLFPALISLSCHNGKENKTEIRGENHMKLSSAAFANEGKIPSVYTCDDKDISPPLTWSSIPADAKSLALIADDPDAPMGTWVHWVIYNIPVTAGGLTENYSHETALADGTLQGRSDFGKIGYGGPCPPSGRHRYYFKLYALDTSLETGAGLDKAGLLTAMDGHVLAQTELMGTYRRQ